MAHRVNCGLLLLVLSRLQVFTPRAVPGRTGAEADTGIALCTFSPIHLTANGQRLLEDVIILPSFRRGEGRGGAGAQAQPSSPEGLLLLRSQLKEKSLKHSQSKA